MYTGREPGAGTKAQPYIHLTGSRGDTGRRLLFKDLTGSKRPFEAGHMAVFELQAVDLDNIEKIMLGHDGHGKGKNDFVMFYIDLLSRNRDAGT